ncbi:MAG: TetR/AcrR family transcriptional regulator [Lactococcus plantarum]|nr:TetR/AcrR family transcriptional regulator [Lactococcus plantarum]MDN6083862.1 TetR/AcrR family transcriptional regulator [Lactococcus plantarum]
MITKKNDLRYVTTDKKITETFLALLDMIGYHKISVSMVVRQATINRSTFYEHFLDKEDLMAQVQIRLITEIIEGLPEVTILKLDDHELVNSRINLLIKRIYEHKKIIKLFLSPKSDGLFLSRFSVFSEQFLIEANIVQAINIPDVYVFSIFQSMMFNLIQKWIERDFIETPEELSKIVSRILPKTMRLLID